ncbi:MAG: 50S ribosomal protein L17 [Methylacidiphilales bacterium]|nr:50S ribosomal protein L17 [Candidatus Methylacidiphilales bacterium]MDW8348961.1 50S ribosomal protein L17 [Verrucomicrobiae bacterium]
MRHRKIRGKLGRKKEHRERTIAQLATALIRHNRITTTLAKAKATRPFAEKLVTLGKKGTLHHRRLAIARVKGDKEAIKKLFEEIVPAMQDRKGGYTRILRLGSRSTGRNDAAPMAILEWVNYSVKTDDAPQIVEGKKKATSKEEVVEVKESPTEKEEQK